MTIDPYAIATLMLARDDIADLRATHDLDELIDLLIDDAPDDACAEIDPLTITDWDMIELNNALRAMILNPND